MKLSAAKLVAAARVPSRPDGMDARSLRLALADELEETLAALASCRTARGVCAQARRVAEADRDRAQADWWAEKERSAERADLLREALFGPVPDDWEQRATEAVR